MSKDIPENPLLGSLMYLRHCRGCQEKSGRIERFVDLSLTLPEARNVSLSGVGEAMWPCNYTGISITSFSVCARPCVPTHTLLTICLHAADYQPRLLWLQRIVCNQPQRYNFG